MLTKKGTGRYWLSPVFRLPSSDFLLTTNLRELAPISKIGEHLIYQLKNQN